LTLGLFYYNAKTREKGEDLEQPEIKTNIKTIRKEPIKREFINTVTKDSKSDNYFQI